MAPLSPYWAGFLSSKKTGNVDAERLTLNVYKCIFGALLSSVRYVQLHSTVVSLLSEFSTVFALDGSAQVGLLMFHYIELVPFTALVTDH